MTHENLVRSTRLGFLSARCVIWRLLSRKLHTNIYITAGFVVNQWLNVYLSGYAPARKLFNAMLALPCPERITWLKYRSFRRGKRSYKEMEDSDWLVKDTFDLLEFIILIHNSYFYTDSTVGYGPPRRTFHYQKSGAGSFAMTPSNFRRTSYISYRRCLLEQCCHLRIPIFPFSSSWSNSTPSRQPTGPNLFGYVLRDWLAGLLME